MKRTWQLQEAKARFSELVEETLAHGPQVVTKRGVETAVLVSFKEWQELQRRARPTLIAFLLEDGPRFELDIPPRARLRRRPPLNLE